MKVNIEEIKDKLRNIVDSDARWLAVPLDREDGLEHSLDCNDFYFVWYDFEDSYIVLDYSESGKFNLYSDWNVELYPNGKFKGKGSVRHKNHIKHVIKWLIKISYDENYHYLLMKSPE